MIQRDLYFLSDADNPDLGLAAIWRCMSSFEVWIARKIRQSPIILERTIQNFNKLYRTLQLLGQQKLLLTHYLSNAMVKNSTS